MCILAGLFPLELGAEQGAVLGAGSDQTRK